MFSLGSERSTSLGRLHRHDVLGLVFPRCCFQTVRVRRRSLHVLWITPCVLLAASLWISWSSYSVLSREGSWQEPYDYVALDLRADEIAHTSDNDILLIPLELRPISYPELNDYLTGPEILALRGKRPHPEEEEQANNSTTNTNNSSNGKILDGVERQEYGGELAAGCARVDMDRLTRGMACGSPLSAPCFDRTRCRAPPHGPGPTVYIYDADCSLENSSELPPSNESLQLSYTWREAAREAGILAETYEAACMFVHVNKRTDRDPCPVGTPMWNGGANHVMVDLTDNTRDRRRAVADSLAMDAASNVRTCYYRSGYDFAVPLRQKWDLYTNFTDIAPWEREFFLTVKANLYLSGTGYDERYNLISLHNETEGTVMALKCFELHDEYLYPENIDFCDALNATSERYDYVRLMNSTFGLVPAGRSPATYRLAEVMSAGAIPVFVTRDYVRPFPERVDWPSLSFMFPPEDVGVSMMDTLRAVKPAQLWEMQRKSLEAFLDIFGETPGYSRIARVVLDELVKRVGFHG